MDKIGKGMCFFFPIWALRISSLICIMSLKNNGLKMVTSKAKFNPLSKNYRKQKKKRNG